MQRRILRRQASKDDSNVRKLMTEPENSLPKANSNKAINFQKKASCDDLHFRTRSNRADRYIDQFVQVHIGRQEFKGETVIDAVIAIYLQASDRLYEIVLVDRNEASEIVRLYVLEDELDEQLQKRYEALIRIFRTPQSVCEHEEIPIDNTVRRQSINSQNNGALTPGRGRRDAHTTTTKNTSLRQSSLASIPSFSKEVVRDPVKYFNLILSTNKSSANTLTKVTLPEIESARDDWLKADSCNNFQEDDGNEGSGSSFIDSDMSSSTSKDITFYVSVILQSLYISQQNSETSFRLFDDISECFYKTFNRIPKEIKSTVPTFVDCKSLVGIAMQKWEIYEKTKVDAVAAKELLDTADMLLNIVVVEEKRQTSYGTANTINPNTKKYRLLWQAAYAAVVASIRRDKTIRNEWKNLLDIAKNSKEREDIMKLHAKEGKFREYAAGDFKESIGMISPDEIKIYRDALKSKKQSSTPKSRKGSRSLKQAPTPLY